jgi:hypothetical protein
MFEKSKFNEQNTKIVTQLLYQQHSVCFFIVVIKKLSGALESQINAGYSENIILLDP